MTKSKPRRSEFIRLRISPQERQIIDAINSSNFITNISEHVRRSLHFYAAHNFPSLVAFKSSK